VASGELGTDSGDGAWVSILDISLKVRGAGGRRYLSACDAILASESVKPGVKGVVVIVLGRVVVPGEDKGAGFHIIRGNGSLYVKNSKEFVRHARSLPQKKCLRRTGSFRAEFCASWNGTGGLGNNS